MTAPTGPSSVEALEKALNELLLRGKALEAFERFYADEIEIQDNDSPPVVGKQANRAREQAFFNAIEQLHRVELLGWAVNGDRSYSEWIYEFTLRGGERLRMCEVSARRWRDGQVVHERYYYKPG